MAMKVGIQLYSVRNHMAQDPIDTIRKVMAAGYRNIEVANHCADKDPGVGFGVSAKEICKLLDEGGAQIFSAHIGPLDFDNINAVLDYHKEVGTKYIVRPIDFFSSHDEALRRAELLNKIGERCKEYGMKYLYHNHFHEFQKLDGETVFDTLLNNTDPDLVGFELDTYWTSRGQQNPAELLKRLGKRVQLVHQKDFTKGYEAEQDLLASVEANGDCVDMARFERDIRPETFTEIGTGILDIQSIIDAANTYCGAEYIVLEQDYSRNDEIESIGISMDSFHKFNGVQW